MSDFLLELLSEEIPARMQDKARADLARLFEAQIGEAGLKAEAIETFATPRRLALIARGLPAQTEAVGEELKGPRTSAPPQALQGFLRKTGLTQDRLEERDGIWYARLDKPGRPTADVLAEAIPAIARAFPWPKSMRWGEASVSTESPRWVRPLQGIVALLGEQIVDFEIAGISSGAATVGHRFHHPGPITIGGAGDYAEKLRACHVIVDPEERKTLIRDGAARAAAEAGMSLVEDEGLVAENAGLTEWPLPLLGAFDPAFLEVPREVIQLTMRTNQKYFALTQSSPSLLGEGDHAQHGGGANRSEPNPSTTGFAGGPPPRYKLGEDQLAPAFICTANILASDGGAAIVEGNRKVLAARLADAKFFWEHDLRVPLEAQAEKLSQIVFHEKLGTVADKVERVAKLARWLVEEGIVKPPPGESVEELASFVETAARLCKADLVTGLVGEFPELQGVIGGHLALCQGHARAISDAIRDHYKPVGQGDEVPTAPVTVAVSLADKLDTVSTFFAVDERPTGSKDPFALRRAALGIIQLVLTNGLRFSISAVAFKALWDTSVTRWLDPVHAETVEALRAHSTDDDLILRKEAVALLLASVESLSLDMSEFTNGAFAAADALSDFFADRLKVQQREAGVRHDLIDAVFALGGEDDLVRLLARVKALQGFVETKEGADLLAGYKRAANILKKEGWGTPLPEREGAGVGAAAGGLRADEGSLRSPPTPSPSLAGRGEQGANKPLSYTPEKEETALIAALDSAEPRAVAAVEAEDFEGAMAALASLRAPVDAFFDKVTVNDPDKAKRASRLALLARMRDAVHRVADFSRIEG